MTSTTIFPANMNANEQLSMELTIPFTEEDPAGKLPAFSGILDALPRQPILNSSWPDYGTDCSAWFSMLYSPQAFLLKFFIKNDFFKSVPRAVNQSVHLDNCVEFFVQFNDDACYYNIEFNCLGSGKMAYGAGNKNRKYISADGVGNILTSTHMEQKGDRFNWEMMLMIPVSSFEFHQLKPDKNLKCRGNFYKCGDLLPQPHFLTWSRIEAKRPNFHSPAFFKPIHLSEKSINNILAKNCVR